MSYTLQTHQLTKKYHGKKVVSGVNMNVKQGEIYGLLGPNGAGKTTIMKMITNLINMTGGEIEVFGQKLGDASFDLYKRIGSIIEYPIFFGEFTARKNLEIHCNYMGYHQKNAIPQVLERVELKHIEDKAVEDFSLGMKQKLGIARAIITRPEFLILDEPVNGLDPVGIHKMRDLLLTLTREYGTTLLISSHILGEIEQIADTIGTLRDGVLIDEVSMDAIHEKKTNYLELNTSQTSRTAFILENQLGISNFQVDKQKGIKIYDMSTDPNTILQMLASKSVIIDSFNKKQTSLEDYFLQLISGGN